MRELPADPLPVSFESFFERYANVSWPGLRRDVSFWEASGLSGVSATFIDPKAEDIIREWLITNCQQVANVAGFASAQLWTDSLSDCEALVRSVRFVEDG